MKGARVANLPLSPVMAFIDTSETVIGVEIQQIYTRYIAPGQGVEVTLKFYPGQVFTGKVVSVLEATSAGQVLATGTAVTTGNRLRRRHSSFASNLMTTSLPPACRLAPPVTGQFTSRTSSRATSSGR
jgi:hypothetical protein